MWYLWGVIPRHYSDLGLTRRETWDVRTSSTHTLALLDLQSNSTVCFVVRL